MAMAHRAPFDSYTMRYNVLPDTISQLRELVPRLKGDAQPPQALARYIDEAVHESISLKLYEKIIDHSAKHDPREGMLVTLPDRVGKGIYAVVHIDKFAKKGRPTHIVLSLQDQAQVDWNKTNGTWDSQQQPGKGILSVGMKIPAEKLEAIRKEMAQQPLIVASDDTRAAPQRYRVAWVKFANEDDEEGTDMEQVFLSREELVQHLEELANDDLVADVQPFKEVFTPSWEPMKIRKKVTLE